MQAPSRHNMDLALLRTFVAIGESGSMAAAARLVSRSQPAISSQMKRLESALEVELLRKRGRGLELTEVGLSLLSHARALLKANDAAIQAISSTSGNGALRLGIAQDFCDDYLTAALESFNRLYPRALLEVSVETGAILQRRLGRDELDMVLSFGSNPAVHSLALGEVPLVWIGRAGVPIGSWHEGIRLVAFEAPCDFRKMAEAALTNTGRQWHVTFSSRSLSSQRSAVSAGLGLMVRTPIGAHEPFRVLGWEEHLPALPMIPVTLGYSPGCRSDWLLCIHGAVSRLLAHEPSWSPGTRASVDGSGPTGCEPIARMQIEAA